MLYAELGKRILSFSSSLFISLTTTETAFLFCSFWKEVKIKPEHAESMNKDKETITNIEPITSETSMKPMVEVTSTTSKDV